LAVSGCTFYPGGGVVDSGTTPENVRRIDRSRKDVSQILLRGGKDVFLDARMDIDRVPEGGMQFDDSSGAVWVRRNADAGYAVEVPDDKGGWKRSWPPARSRVDFIAAIPAELYREGASEHAALCPMVLRAGRYVMFLSYGGDGWTLRQDELDLAGIIGVHNPASYALFFDIDREYHTAGFTLSMLPWDGFGPAVGRDGYLLGGVTVAIPDGGSGTHTWTKNFEIVAIRFTVPP
jgi:hypothetical protein